MAHQIVFGNEKGGSGKSTTAMHVTMALLSCGKSVGVLDLDLRQRSLTRYVENRQAYCQRNNNFLPMPTLSRLKTAAEVYMLEGPDAAYYAFQSALAELRRSNDFIVIDCAGSYSHLAELAHAAADTLVTPLNDSFVDFDLLARFDPDSGKVLGPSIYAEMVWKARQTHAAIEMPAIDWVVLRNRVGQQDMHNKRRVGNALAELSKRIGFRIAPGFSERVIFREMFAQGLTLLDAGLTNTIRMNISNIAARQEIRDLLNALALPGVEVGF